MRLLYRSGSGNIRQEEFEDGEIPPYAILSHTWGRSSQETTYSDFKRGRQHATIGFEKLQFCVRQATKDGIQYSWVDTCCIDKDRSQELKESLNSMFRWYKNALKCYVLLSDVSKNSWREDFKRSRWFTRGWTLQELLAPSEVEFFSKEHKFLGTKETLSDLIVSITGIPKAALSGARLSTFSVAERFAWMKNRQTNRPEDIAYAQLGMFDVTMDIIYSEGKESAMRRLTREIEERTPKLTLGQTSAAVARRLAERMDIPSAIVLWSLLMT